jgi:hypothetical protein
MNSRLEKEVDFYLSQYGWTKYKVATSEEFSIGFKA